MRPIEIMRSIPRFAADRRDRRILAGASARGRRLLAVSTLAVALGAGGPTLARAGQTVTLKTSFSPDRLGVRVTVKFGFAVHSTVPGKAPAPVTNFDLHLPAGLGVSTSSLGLANCQSAMLIAQGPEGCPGNARVGFGSALVAVATETEPVEEEGTLDVFVGAPNKEHLEVLFYAEASSPVSAQLVFPGRLLEDGSPFSGRLDTTVPLIPTWPGGADLSVTHMTSTIGPLGLTYHRRVHGKLVPFKPRGIALPRTCPHRGFPFRADLTFLNGSHASATSTIPCPRR